MGLCTSLLLLILLSSSCLLGSSIGRPHTSSNGTSSTNRTIKIARRSAEANGCTTSSGIHIPSNSSQYSHLTLSPSPLSPPIDSMDICFVISNSRTMPQRWIQILAVKIDNLLKAQGIGSNSTNQNHFIIVEFGGRGSDIEPRLLWNSSFFISDIIQARRKVKKNGFVGDGFDALKFALDNAPFRDSPSVKKAFILGADTGRTILAQNHDLTLSLLSDLISRSGASLDVVTNFTMYPSYQGRVPLGFYNYSTTVFNASNHGHETLKVPVKITSSHGNTLSSYVDLSLSVGGGVWSLDPAKDANVNLVSSLASAVFNGWNLRDRRECLECYCIDGAGQCKSAMNQRICRNCINNNNDEECLSNDKSLAVFNATATVFYPDKQHNYVKITLSSNTDLSYRYLHFNSTNHILQYTLSPLLLHNLSVGIHTVMIIGRTSSGGVETAKLVQFEIKYVPFGIQFLPSTVDQYGTLIIPFRSSWVQNVYCLCKGTRIELHLCFNEYRADPNVIGSGNHTLSVKCYYQPESLSVTEEYNFNLKSAPEIPSTVLHCGLNLSQGPAPFTVAVSINCNREATTNCSIANLPPHQCNGSYTFSTSSLSPGYYPFRLEAHDQYGYTYSIVSVFTVQPIDRICCPIILRNSARVLVSNSTSTSSTSTQSSSNGVRMVTFSTDISTGNCSLTEGFSYNMSWSPQTVQSGSVPLHHSPMTFSMTFTGRGTHTISFSYCNNPTTRSNICCDQLSLPLSLS